MLKFYANPVSPFAAKVHFMLEEVSIPFTYHGLNLRDDKARQELTAVNPFGKVPAIDLNGFKIGESNAILRYLAARFERLRHPKRAADRSRSSQPPEIEPCASSKTTLPVRPKPRPNGGLSFVCTHHYYKSNAV